MDKERTKKYAIYMEVNGIKFQSVFRVELNERQLKNWKIDSRVKVIKEIPDSIEVHRDYE